MRQAQALLARAGFDPERVLFMTEAEVESHLAALLTISGARKASEVETTRYVSQRRKRKET